jgi:beta-lactamase regulating signal transducer with metallopeptidase domain
MELIALALVASCWIGLLAGLLGIAASRALPSPRARYAVLLGALILTPACSILYAAVASTPAADFPSPTPSGSILSLWAIGASAMASRLLISGFWLRHLLGRSWTSDAVLTASFDKVARSLGFKKIPELRVTHARLSPCTVCVLRSVVLIPASVVSHLSPAQVEAVLAHELAHVLRWDYWANALQLAIESLLFFHPAVWVLSRLVTLERELCCDEVAAEVVGDRSFYAEALAAVAIGPRVNVAPAATTAIAYRLQRLLSPTSGPASVGRGSGFALALCAVLAVVAYATAPAKLVFIKDLPPHWTASARLQRPNGLIEIDLRSQSGSATIKLTQPTPERPRTWFTVTDRGQSIRYHGERRPSGQIVFHRVR